MTPEQKKALRMFLNSMRNDGEEMVCALEDENVEWFKEHFYAHKEELEKAQKLLDRM